MTQKSDGSGAEPKQSRPGKPRKVRAPAWVTGMLQTGREAASQFIADKCPRLAAALAYYTLVSLVPLLFLVLVVASLVYDAGVAREAMLAEVREGVGADVADLVDGALDAASAAGTGWIGLVIGGVLLLVAATTVLGELQGALNQVWGLQAPRGKGFLRILRERALSMLLVVMMGVLLVGSLALEASVSALGRLAAGAAWVMLFPLFDFVVSVGLLTVFLAAVYKVLPDAVIEWRDVWWGAVFTAVLLALGKVGIGWYVGRTATASAYGAAGALAILLVWVYLASMLFFLGAELTEIRAAQRGRIVARRGAIRVLPQRVPVPIEMAPRELKRQA